MKIIFVNKPLQSKTSTDLEHVEYREEYNEIDCIMELRQHIPEWCVDTERTRPQFNLRYGNREFMDWFIKKEKDILNINERLERELSDIRIDGIYLYDIGSMFQKMYKSQDEIVDAITFYPRYAYIKIKI